MESPFLHHSLCRDRSQGGAEQSGFGCTRSEADGAGQGPKRVPRRIRGPSLLCLEVLKPPPPGRAPATSPDLPITYVLAAEILTIGVPKQTLPYPHVGMTLVGNGPTGRQGPTCPCSPAGRGLNLQPESGLRSLRHPHPADRTGSPVGRAVSADRCSPSKSPACVPLAEVLRAPGAGSQALLPRPWAQGCEKQA